MTINADEHDFITRVCDEDVAESMPRRLSDDPAVQLAECRGESVPPAGGEVGWTGKRKLALETALRLVASEESFTRLQAENAQLVVDCWEACGGNGPSNRDDLLIALRLMNEAEDELTAERDDLKADIERLQSESFESLYNSAIDERDAAQAELTKARELLAYAATTLREPLLVGWEDDLAEKLEAELVHQSAPAAKGGDL